MSKGPNGGGAGGGLQIRRSGLIISVRQKNKFGEWDTVSTVRSIDKFGGKLAKEMSDEELLKTWSPKSRDWSH